MSFQWIFPIPIFHTDLYPEEHEAKAMLRQLKIFDRHVLKKASIHGHTMMTGDKLGKIGLDQMHHSGKFQWLNQQLSTQVKIFLNTLFGVNAPFDVHIQKSWPVVCKANGGSINRHDHRNADLSAVFYIQVDPCDNSGSLIFHCPLPQLNNYPGSSEGALGGNHIEIKPKNNRLIIFPSYLEHEVSPCAGTINRYSISYDLTITSHVDRGEEMLLQHPSNWTSLGDY